MSDDGDGIAFADLRSVGQRYSTSKLKSRDDLDRNTLTVSDYGSILFIWQSHGFRGEALASLRDVAIVEVVTRCKDSAVTYANILRGDGGDKVSLLICQRTHFRLPCRPHQGQRPERP